MNDSVNITVTLKVGNVPSPDTILVSGDVLVRPPIMSFKESIYRVSVKLNLITIPIKLKSAALAVLKTLIGGKISTFFDDSRNLKTLLNFGEDYQALITNWKYSEQDSSKSSIVVKMYEPLPDEVDEREQLWISRELSPPVIDRLLVKFTPPPPPKVYLRPPNKDIHLTGKMGVSVNNVSMGGLLSSGAFDPIHKSDKVLEEWYTDDINSSELNIDYSDYSNFIFFGSAKFRIDAFVNKLKLLESYDKIINDNSASLAAASPNITGSATYAVLQSISDKRLDLLRSFDAYERFLYYGTATPYSSSFLKDTDDAIYYNPDATWPKESGVPVPVSSASAWIETQRAIGIEYDRQNANSIVNTLPKHIKEDESSEDFVKFAAMVGHQYDIMKPYIDQMTNIYDRNSDPSEGISPDLIWNIAESLGIQLPNQYSINRLVDYTIGDTGMVDPKVYRMIAAETWKRFIHNQIFMMKTKGTKTSLRTLANSYGILPTTLQIREGVFTGIADSDGSYEVYEEQTNALQVPSGSYIEIPWSGSGVTPETIEIRFSTTDPSSSVLLSADTDWAVRLTHVDGVSGRMSLMYGNTTVVSSEILPLYNGEFFSVMVRNHADGTQLGIKRADGDAIVDDYYGVESVPQVSAAFLQSATVYLGGSGSFFGTPFNGMIDEVRVWSEYLSDNIFEQHTKYPGMYGGNLSTSARDNLLVRLSFSTIKNLGGTDKTIKNETPCINIPAEYTTLQTVNFPNIETAPYNTTVVVREVMRLNQNVSTTQFSTNNVIIAPPAELTYLSGSSIPVLSPTTSTVSVADKAERTTLSNTVGFYFSITDAINDSITRTIGNFDLNNLIGDPADEYNLEYKNLQSINELYWNNYAYEYDVNKFVDFVKNLLGPLFEQARELVPVRAKLLSGIVHEPHILERSKVVNRRLIETSAGAYGRNDEMQNLDAVPVTSNPDEVSAEFIQYDAVYDIAELHDIDADESSYDVLINSNDTLEVSSEFDQMDTDIFMIDSTQILTDFIYHDDLTDILNYKSGLLGRFGAKTDTDLSGVNKISYDTLVNRYKATSVIRIRDQYMTRAKGAVDIHDDVGYTFPAIKPQSDFSDIGSYTYFTDPNGLIGTTLLKYSRIGKDIQTERGSWVKGTTYNRNDVVTVGANEYVCITPSTTFVSYISAESDKTNWKQASYQPSEVMEIKKAALVDNVLSVVPVSSPYPSAIGYMPNHYKFTRDKRRGIINHQWLGCLQTDKTTIDGKAVVEINYTDGDILVVNNGASPIKQDVGTAGPILDVR